MNTTVYNKQTIEFITVVKEYVAICENRKEQQPLHIAIYILRLLPLIYLKALLLPEFEKVEDELVDVVDEQAYNDIKAHFDELWGELDIDCPVPHFPVQYQEQNIAPISELLADIYQDLKNVMVNFQTGDEDIMESSLCVCKENFEIYWGQRLLAASSALHHLVYDRKEDFENIKPKTHQALEDIDTSNWIINQIRKPHNE